MANSNLNNYKKTIMEIFQQYEVPCFIQESKETLFNYKYDIILKDVKSLTKVNKITKALQMALHNQSISCEEGKIETTKTTMISLSFVVPKEKVEVVGYNSIQKRVNEEDSLVLYGINEDYSIVYHDFEKDGNILICGDYKTGKTNINLVILNSLLRKNEIKIEIASVNKVYKVFGRYKQKVMKLPKDNAYNCYQVLYAVVHEIAKRQKQKKENLPPIYLIIDDWEYLVSSVIKDSCDDAIKAILEKGLKQKIYTILTLTKLEKLKDDYLRYFETKFVLKTSTPSISTKLLGTKAAYNLYMPGVAIVKNEKEQKCVRILDLKSDDAIKISKEKKAACSSDEIVSTLKTYNNEKTLNTITKNFIEKCGKLYYLDLFVFDKCLSINDFSNIACVNIAKYTLQVLSNANEIFYECQRIKNETDDSVFGNESLYLDKATFSTYNELRFLYETLVGQNMIENDDLHKTAFYLFVYEKYNEYLKELYDIFSKKYSLQREDEDKIINEMLSAGYGIQEIKNYLALKQYCEQGNKEMSYDVCVENLGTKVEDAFKVMKQKRYIESLLNVNKQTKKTTLHDIDRMSGKEFEEFIAELFANFGYETTITKASADQGIDVLATKQDVTIGIQAKCYSGQVGNHAIMEAVAGCKYYKANKCMVITNSIFTPSAIKLAEANEVELWDRNVLEKKVLEK